MSNLLFRIHWTLHFHCPLEFHHFKAPAESMIIVGRWVGVLVCHTIMYVFSLTNKMKMGCLQNIKPIIIKLKWDTQQTRDQNMITNCVTSTGTLFVIFDKRLWYLLILFSIFEASSKKQNCTEAQRYHCKYNFTAASFISLPRDLFYCRDFYFTAASFILAPRVLFNCREFYYTAASFILPLRVLFSAPQVLFYCKWWK